MILEITERNSDRVRFRDKKVKGLFVDNQQDEIILQKTSLHKKR